MHSKGSTYNAVEHLNIQMSDQVMNREEKIAKLKTWGGLAYPTVMTQDMGLQYVAINQEGMYTGLGLFSEWPIYRVLVDDKIHDIVATLHYGGEVTKETLRNSCFGDILRVQVHDDCEATFFESVIQFLTNIALDVESFWVFCQPDEVIQLSVSFEEVIKIFMERNVIELYFWDEIDDGEIDEVFDLCEENSWSFPFICINEPKDSKE